MKKDNIEEIYGELGEFSKEPPKELWNQIEARLHPKKKRRGIIFFWSSVAAVLVMFLGYVFINSLEPNSKPINEVSGIEQPKDDNTINESNQKTTEIVEGLDISNTNEDSLVEKSIIIKELLNNGTGQKQLTNRKELLERKEERKHNLYEKSINNKKQNSNDNNSYAQNSLKENVKIEKEDKVNDKNLPDLQRKNKSVIDYKKEALLASNDSITKVKDLTVLDLIEKLVAVNENIADSTITNKASLKWSVEVLGGLSNTASEASIQGTSVNTTSQNDFVYTLKVGYALSDRLVIKSGIGKNILGQEINKIKYTSADASLMANNSESIVNNQDIIFLVSEESFHDISAGVENTNEGTLQQQFDYVQIPLEVSYNVLKAQKFDVSIGVGGNLNFLTNNRAFLDNEQIGESLGVDSTVFGATMNSNISFQLAKKTILFLEPNYNYFEKPIDNNNQTFNNTQLRVLFGLRYKL